MAMAMPWPCKAEQSAFRQQPAKARLAQSVERKALNLVVVGSSPTVGVAAAQLRSPTNLGPVRLA